MPVPDFVVHAHSLALDQQANALGEDAILAALRDDAPAWVHLDGTDPDAGDWVASQLGYLDSQAIEALLDADTRARLTVLGEGMILILRDVNFNAGEKPEDMVSVRMWIDAHRIVTISRKKLRAIDWMDAALRAGTGPVDAGEFLVKLIEDTTQNIGDFQKELDLIANELEHKVISEIGEGMRRQVADLRLKVIAARRFLGPQRDALGLVGRTDLSFLNKTTRREIEEEYVKMTRIVEDMDELRDQALVLREDLSGQLSDRLNRNMFLLSVLTAVFLPLGFLTGLFGVNVAGLPGLEDSRAFIFLCLAMGALVLLQVLLLWRLRWIGRGG